jgi:hypothetical protein
MFLGNDLKGGFDKFFNLVTTTINNLTNNSTINNLTEIIYKKNFFLQDKNDKDSKTDEKAVQYINKKINYLFS